MVETDGKEMVVGKIRNPVTEILEQLVSKDCGVAEDGIFFANKPKLCFVNVVLNREECGYTALVFYSLRKRNGHFFVCSIKDDVGSLSWNGNDSEPDARISLLIPERDGESGALCFVNSALIPIVYANQRRYGFLWSVLESRMKKDLEAIKIHQPYVQEWFRSIRSEDRG